MSTAVEYQNKGLFEESVKIMERVQKNIVFLGTLHDINEHNTQVCLINCIYIFFSFSFLKLC